MTRDHELQMSRERPEAICPPSDTGRHQFFITINYAGQAANVPSSGIVTCEACGQHVMADKDRWVLVTDETRFINEFNRRSYALPRFLTLPRYVIKEDACIEDVIAQK